MFRLIASICVAILMTLCVISNECDAAQLHAIIISDTTNPDTAVERIFDLTNISSEVNQISYYTGMKLNEKRIYGTDLTIENVYNALNELQVEADDAVILYFGLDGFRDENKENNEFPYLFFPYSQDGVDISDFHETIRQKNPRLLISINESSNDYVAVDAIPVVNKKFFWDSKVDEYKKVNYQKLFLSTKGEILISSTSPGGFVYLYPQKGHVYTLKFLEKLQDAVKLETPAEWPIILKKTSVAVQKDLNSDGFVQYPHYEIDIKD